MTKNTCPEYHYPYIGKRFVINLPEIKTAAADFAWDQHEPLRAAKCPHPQPARTNGMHVAGQSLWGLMSAAQETIVEAHRGIVDALVTVWRTTRDEDIKARLIEAGYSHRIASVEALEKESAS